MTYTKYPQIESLERRELLSFTPQTITVRVFFDRNSDFHRNHTETGIAGVHVTAKGLLNASNARVNGTATTDSNGVARFTSYVDSNASTSPSAAISLGALTKYRCLNFVPNAGGAVSGIAAPNVEFAMVDYATVVGHIGYYYKARNDPSAGLPSRRVFDDQNKNGKRDRGEPAADTDSNGDYSLMLRGGSHTLRVATSKIWSAAPGSTLVENYTLQPGKYTPPAVMTPMMTKPIIITLLAGYTSAARQFISNGVTNKAPAYISSMLYQANKVYANSDTNVRLRLVGTAETSYEESGSINADLTHLHDHGDGKLDDLLAARDNTKADLVTLITAPDFAAPHDDDDTIGLGYQFQRGADNDELGMSVVRLVDRDEDGFTLAHEIGHNLGAGHDPGNVDDDILIAPYAHGYIFRGANGKNYRDIMAYGDAEQLPFFSSPLFKFAGKPIGNTKTADNARIIAEIAPEVAAFR